jgi:hypothetical protein
MESAWLLVLGIGFLVFWVYQFVQLMLLSEADFPGKYDKCLWAAAFIIAFVAAPFAFLGWKAAYSEKLDWLRRMKKPDPPKQDS